MGAQGTADLDFGAFPGKSDASVVVTGQAAIVDGSLAEAWLRPVATADHSADEHMVETLKVFAATIVANIGFTIYGFNASQLNEPVPDKHANGEPGSVRGGGGRRDNQEMPDKGGKGTRIYGVWKVAWAWN